MNEQMTAESVYTVDSIRLRLLGCETSDEVESVFSEAKINDFSARTEFLHRAMQIRKIYGIPSNEEIDVASVYRYYLEFYLEGEWKDLV